MKYIKYVAPIIIIISAYFIASKVGEEYGTETRTQPNNIAGEKLPQFFVYDEKGAPFLIHKILTESNKENVIILYSFSCSTCLAQANEWKKFNEKFINVKINGIAFETDKKELVKFEKRTGLSFKNWRSAEKTIKQLKVNVWPTYIKVNPITLKVEKIYEGVNGIKQLNKFYEETNA